VTQLNHDVSNHQLALRTGIRKTSSRDNMSTQEIILQGFWLGDSYFCKSLSKHKQCFLSREGTI